MCVPELELQQNMTSGNNSCVNLGVLNGQWGYDLKLFIRLVIRKECDNECEQSYPHHANQRGKNCLTRYV